MVKVLLFKYHASFPHLELTADQLLVRAILILRATSFKVREVSRQHSLIILVSVP
jgi:hypothetical protein